MNSRERVSLALNHQEADRLPLDLGGSNVTGMNVSAVYKLRQALGLDAPGTPVKVVEPYQMLGEIAPDLLDALGVDVVPLRAPRTMFGFPNEGWKPWTIFDGTPVLVPEGFNIDPEPNGDLLMYPEGDKAALPSGRMPKDGFYFDAVIRQYPVDDEKLNVADNLEEFTPVTEGDLAYYRTESERLYATGRAVFADFGGTSFGDVAAVPGIQMRQHPKGIRDIQEWYMSTAMRQDYVYQVFEGQCEMGLANLRRVYEVVGERVTLCFVTGADFGMQGGPLISPRTYRKLFQPFHKRINEWIHTNTGWKTFIHSCGSVVNLIEDFIASGFDIVNPVQTSAAGMDPRELKRRFGDRVTFWGGGVDTQKELPYGTPDEVRAQVRERIETFGPGGGFVFNTVHNVQPKTPIENVLAMYETVAEYGRYVQRDPVAR